MITDSNISQVFQSALCTRFSPTIPAHLCALPGELLELICSFIGEWDVFPCRKRSIYLILSHTSKRLRDFCLPLYFRRARIANVSDLWDYTRFLESAGHKDSIRYLRLGTREFARYWRKASNYRERAAVLAMAAPCKSHSFHETALPRLPSLQEFICMDNTFRVSSLAASFRHSPLRRLSVAWNDDRFPDIGNMFPELQHLCLVLAIKQKYAGLSTNAFQIFTLSVCMRQRLILWRYFRSSKLLRHCPKSYIDQIHMCRRTSIWDISLQLSSVINLVLSISLTSLLIAGLRDIRGETLRFLILRLFENQCNKRRKIVLLNLDLSIICFPSRWNNVGILPTQTMGKIT
ncbi:hypothetical protein BDP27DRAFT_411347 [Rhodocollybia butyracea]|uniref:F-box domain-containing protein n=1 Tax=Rhodocollybia butyracea TaxID=206335 RepID=A0A9P5Q034_9AGAR|nr:hypothetical protein BDP27DRAFT_411347 [Rhodocollybia butyracea]